MIQETQVTLRKQTPTAPNEWLYKTTFEQREKEVVNENGETETITEEVEVRTFHPSVYLGKDDIPYMECTNEEKLTWESTHKQEEPQEVEQ
jgi:hypothetical protein